MFRLSHSLRLTTAVAAALSLIAACNITHSEEPRPKNGLDPTAKDQIYRTGDKIIPMGGHMAGPDHATIRALQTLPADDSGKFHCSIGISDHPQFKPACDKLLHDVDVAEQFLAFIKLKDPSKSWIIPQIRKYEDVSQKHWFDGLKPVIFPTDKDGNAIPLKDADGNVVPPFPHIVIKPPLNGRYGQNDEVVTVVFGYNGNVKGTCDKIQQAIEEWIHEHESKGLVQAASDEPFLGAGRRPQPDLTNPFEKPGPLPPANPFDPAAQGQWPSRFNKPTTPPAPVPLTAKQIRELIPNAPRDFRADLAEQEITDPAKVREAWMDYREEQLKALAAQHAEAVKVRPCPAPTDPPPLAENECPDDQAANDVNEVRSEVHSTTANPTQVAQAPTVAPAATSGVNLSLLDLLGIIGIGIGSIVATWFYQKKTAAKQSPESLQPTSPPSASPSNPTS